MSDLLLPCVNSLTRTVVGEVNIDDNAIRAIHARMLSLGPTTDGEAGKLATALLKRISENTDLLLKNQELQAEVERLRAVNESLKSISDESVNKMLHADAEVERLRAELDRVNNEWCGFSTKMETELDAAIARAEKHLQCHTDVPCGACITCLNGDVAAAIARAEAAEALLATAHDSINGSASDCRNWQDSAAEHLTKHGGKSS